ncbi:MAG: phosphoribosylglycinamide formyltransferase, partial [Chitinophagia bacterium]|nr:phosphoribosylglycinamide formyltransferase [Chitinophagia bacterium]
MKRIAIFASGTGSNAEKILAYFKDSADIKIALIVSNKPDAGVLQIANRHKVPTL